MKIPILSVVALLALTSCSPTLPGSGAASWSIKKTAADEALPGAYSVRLMTPSQLQPGRIYKAAGGNFTEICSLDIRDQNALKAITVVADTASPDTVSDEAFFSSIEINAFGLKFGPSYEIRSVSGFRIFNAQAPSSGDVASYILANVRHDGPKTCGGGVLKDPKNLPYFVVEATVVGEKVTVQKMGQASYEGRLGIVGGKADLWKPSTKTRSNVVFGAKGLLVTKLAK